MNELKAYIAPTPDGTGLADYYLKSEADKVIDDLELKLEVTQMALGEAKYHIREHEDVEIPHHKYKRCLDKADLCDEKHRRLAAYVDDDYYTNKEYHQFMSDFWLRWKDKWLELAKHFKPEAQ